MRIAIDHRTVCRLTTPTARVAWMLRLTPQDSDDQVVAAWSIHVDCDCRLREGRDGHGNRVSMLYIEDAPDEVTIAVSGEVLTSASAGIVRGQPEPLPPESYLRRTPVDAAIEALVAEAREVDDPIAQLHRLNDLAHERELDHEAFVGAARLLGTPARFVSGFCRQGEAVAPHRWAEAHVPRLGWVAFDPVIGECPDEAHIRIAAALEPRGVVPIAAPWANLAAKAQAQD